MRKLLWRSAVTALAGGTAVLLAAGPALAHECFNVSRSQRADAQIAAHSHGWFEIYTWQFIAIGAGGGCDAEPCPPPVPGTEALTGVDPDLVIGVILGFAPEAALTPEQQAAFDTLVSFSKQVAAAAEQMGVPDSYLTLANATAAGGAENSGQGVTANGKGIDHTLDVYGDALMQAYAATYCASWPDSPVCTSG